MFTVVTLEDWRVRRILHYIFFWGGQEEDLSSSTRDYLCPLQWKWGVLTTGLPGKPLLLSVLYHLLPFCIFYCMYFIIFTLKYLSCGIANSTAQF